MKFRLILLTLPFLNAQTCTSPTSATVTYTTPDSQQTTLDGSRSYSPGFSQYAVFSYERPTADGNVQIEFDHLVAQAHPNIDGTLSYDLPSTTFTDSIHNIAGRKTYYFTPVNATGICGTAFEIGLNYESISTNYGFDSSTGNVNEQKDCEPPRQMSVQFATPQDKLLILSGNDTYVANFTNFRAFEYQRPTSSGRIAFVFSSKVSRIRFRSPGLIMTFSTPSKTFTDVIDDKIGLQQRYWFVPLNSTKQPCGQLFEVDVDYVRVETPFDFAPTQASVFENATIGSIVSSVGAKVNQTLNPLLSGYRSGAVGMNCGIVFIVVAIASFFV